MSYQKRVHYGIAYNDVYDHSFSEKSYIVWKSMLWRCYSESNLSRNPTYRGCSVCDEWLYYSNFRKWFNERFINKAKQELDKDILVKGNKVYSPSTCCLVPHRVNSLLVKSDANRGELPIGVTKHWTGEGYAAKIVFYGKGATVGHFDNVTDAFLAYKRMREAYIALEANIAYSKGHIDEQVYNALLNYKIEIDD